MAFEGNTHDLGSFGEETDEITDLHQIHEEILFSERGDGVTGIKRRRRDPSSDDVRDLVTASGRGQLNEDLESSTLSFLCVNCFVIHSRQPPWETRILSVLLETTPNLATRATKNTIELPIGNNVVPLRSDTIRLVQNGCSFHGLRSEDPNQHLKDFLKLVDSLDLDGENRERTRLRLFQFSLRDQASNWLECLPAGSITTWEDLTTHFLAQFFPLRRNTKLRNDILITSDRRLIELENQVQRLMEAHLALTQPTQVNKITTLCEICSGSYDTQYCMEDPEQAFVKYASSHTNEARGKWYTFKPEQNNLGNTYNPSWKSHPNLRWRQPQNSQNNFSNPPNRFQSNGSIPNCSFNNRPQSYNNQSNLEGLVSNFMASQDTKLTKFEANFKQQQSEMTNEIDTVLKAITDCIAGALPSDTVKNPKLSTSPVLSARSYPTIDLQCSSHPSTSINAIKAHSKEATISQTSMLRLGMEIETQQPKEPEPTLEDEF
ncbi:MAK10-like protein [Tanacetum coccineum]